MEPVTEKDLEQQAQWEFEGEHKKVRKRLPKEKKQKIDLTKFPQPKSTASAPNPKLSNVVSTFSLGKNDLDLRKIAMHDKVLEFNPQCFAAATLRIKEPRTTALTFASGNVVCTGARNEHESRYAARKYCRVFQQLGLPVCFKDFKIQNVVASVSVGFTLKLFELARDYGAWCSYEPDLFPGLILRSVSPKLVFLVFRSGKLVITGAKCYKEIAETYYRLYYNVILKYRDTEDSDISSSTYRQKIKKRNTVALKRKLKEESQIIASKKLKK